MPFEFEALVGHLMVVGGRSISVIPPGALCEVAPKKAARGRETDTFFALVLPSGDSTAPSAFYTRLANLAAERYFDSTGSVTAGLREVFTTLNNDLHAHNRKPETKAYEADIACAVLRGKDLIVGRVGSAVVLYQERGLTQTFPTDLNDDDAVYLPPLGVQMVPNVRMTQYQVSSGTRLVFTDANIADLVHEQVSSAMVSVDLGTVLVAFKELARLQMALMAVEFVPPDAPEAIDLPVGESISEVQEQLRVNKSGAAATGDGAGAATGRKRPRLSSAIGRRLRRGLGQVAMLMGSGLQIINRLLNRFFGPDAEGKRNWVTTPLGAASVILLPAAVVILVVVLWLSGTGETEFEICIQEAQDNAALARSVAATDRQTIITAWTQTITKIDECGVTRPNEPQLQTLRREGQQVLDELNDISRRPANMLWNFERARLTDIIMQGQAIYVLDSANGLVYRVDVDNSGENVVDWEIISDMRTGGSVDGISVGEIIGIDYNDQRNVFVAVDRQGVLVECQPNFAQNCTGQRLPSTDLWQNPTDMAVWSNNVYILDTGGSGQILRYTPSGTGSAASRYLNASESYFAGNVAAPNLSTGVSLEIHRGAVYVLLAEGLVRGYFNQEPLNFAYQNFPPDQQITSANGMWLDPRNVTQDLYVISQENRAVYETSYEGTFRDQWRALEESTFDLVSAVVAETSGDGRELLYVTSGSAIFVLDKGEG